MNKFYEKLCACLARSFLILECALEKHPHGEEIVYLLNGAMDLTLDRDGDLQTVELRGKGLIIIPRHTWHTAKVLEPSKMLVITFGKDTQVKPI